MARRPPSPPLAVLSVACGTFAFTLVLSLGSVDPQRLDLGLAQASQPVASASSLRSQQSAALRPAGAATKPRIVLARPPAAPPAHQVTPPPASHGPADAHGHRPSLRPASGWLAVLALLAAGVGLLRRWSLTKRSASPSRAFVALTSSAEFSEVTTASLGDELLRAAQRSNRGQGGDTAANREVTDLIARLELAMLGQRTSTSQLNGDWELVWASDDITRSSPFFWAFRQAFPDAADQVFGITDGIPAPLKAIGPARQTLTGCEGPGDGTLVSRVQVKALPDLPAPLTPLTSVVQTTASIVARTPTKLTLRVLDTRITEATLPLWDQAPPFPSGQALDTVRKGAAEVVMSTVFLDARLRISRNDADGATFVWRRAGPAP
eukprot:EG_transcript_12762